MPVEPRRRHTTHTDTHTIALLDERGRPLGAETFTADPDGYDRLIGMLPGPGRVAAVGVEGTNSFGAALARRLTAAGYEVREVLRPRRSVRRRDGKSDPLDAVAAARSVMAGDGTSLPKSSDGWVEALRHLNAQRSQLVSAMTAISNSTNGLLVTAPEPIRERYRGLRSETRMNRLAECRPAGGLVERSVLAALKSAAKAWKALKRQAGLLEERMRLILEEHARPLLDMYCAGAVIAATLAIVAGDNPERIRSEAAFAKLCGVCPIPASSGRTNRHRLNKGGNRQGNSALHHIANGQAEAMEFVVCSSTRNLGTPLKDLKLKNGVLIAGIVRGDQVIIPEGNSHLQVDDIVIVIAKDSGILDLNDIYADSFGLRGAL